MALTVETGAGLADADAFVSVADCDAYCEARGLTDWTGAADSPASIKEAAIRRATAHLSTGYPWMGLRRRGRLQALAWPRTDIVDREGYSVAFDALPIELVQACCEIAAREVATPGFMTPDVVMIDRVRREKVGSLETEYADVGAYPEAAKPVVFVVRELIGQYLNSSGGMYSGGVAR
jgi:hypothetical protein